MQSSVGGRKWKRKVIGSIPLCTETFTVDDIQVLAVPVDGRVLHDNKVLTAEGKHVLQEQNFRSGDFWEGYKLYCYARYSHCRSSRGRFLASKMGLVVRLIHKEDHVRWGSVFDEKVRQVWAMMEEYAEFCIGQDWKNLRALMEEFDDVKELSASQNGSLLLQLVEDDDYGTERLHRESQAVQVQCTNIFDEMHMRLKRVGTNLDSLRESSASSCKTFPNSSRKRCSNGHNFRKEDVSNDIED